MLIIFANWFVVDFVVFNFNHKITENNNMYNPLFIYFDSFLNFSAYCTNAPEPSVLRLL